MNTAQSRVAATVASLINSPAGVSPARQISAKQILKPPD
jgi:hypothetical protein